MLQVRAVVLAAVLMLLASFGAKSADLVVWWEKGFYAQEDEAVAEIVAAFEQETGKHVELVHHPQGELFDKTQAALKAGQPPDFLFGTVGALWIPQWAHDDQLAELGGSLGPAMDLFDTDAIEGSRLFNGSTDRRGLYALPMARTSNHVHVWKSLLERAGFTLADIPNEWEAFWSFWCDQVQPAVRATLGRDDIWAVGLPMSVAATDTTDQLFQFQLAHGSTWLDLGGQPQVDDPKIRQGVVKALEGYTAIWRKACTPPDSTGWTNVDNNKAFLTQTVVMTLNPLLSIPSALRTARPDDYYRNAVTLDWPDDASGQPLMMQGFLQRAVVFKAGRNPALAGDFVRFLAEEGWLAHWLTFAGDRFLPPMRKLVEQPFWLDPTDPHRMRAAMQLLTRPHLYSNEVRGNEWRSSGIFRENVWGRAVHRVVAENISPEQAVDEAIARIKEILRE